MDSMNDDSISLKRAPSFGTHVTLLPMSSDESGSSVNTTLLSADRTALAESQELTVGSYCDSNSERSRTYSHSSGSDSSADKDDESFDSSSYEGSTGSDESFDDYDSSEDSDWSEEYEDLISEIPVCRGGLKPIPERNRAKSKSAADKIGEQAQSSEGLGLETLAAIKRDLEKVGRLIIEKDNGVMERAHILASINLLSSNVPACVLDRLGEEVREKKVQQETTCEALFDIRKKLGCPEETLHLVEETSESEASDLSVDIYPGEAFHSTDGHKMSLPSRLLLPSSREVTQRLDLCEANHEKVGEGLPVLEYFHCALLFVDISGFTKLSTLLDPESLSKVINYYFQQLVDKVTEFNGDVQKFAGDALFAEWRATPTVSLEACAKAAASCAASLTKDCSDFPVIAFGASVFDDSSQSPITTLNVHCGLGIGQMAGVHIGDDVLRREYVYLGDPISQATESCEQASLGEVVCSEHFSRVLGSVVENYYHSEIDRYIIARNGESVITDEIIAESKNAIRNAKPRGITDYVDGLEIQALMQYRKLISLYVHPVVVARDVAAAQSSQLAIQSLQKDQDGAELRSVYVMFIKPLLPNELVGDLQSDLDSANRLNGVMNVVSRELEQYSGHLRQFIVDDKGVVLIATFGLKGSSFPNLVSERALPATTNIYNSLQLELGIDTRIGATFGDVYCGAVGGKTRHEYAVMGPSVNLAARLMSSIDNPGILVDNAVRRLASRTYGFNALDPVRAKGYRDLVPIFEPLCPTERAWGCFEPNFVGRQEEIRAVVSAARDIAQLYGSCARFVLISGQTRIGKSVLLIHAIERARRMIGVSRPFYVVKHASRQGEMHIPLSTVRSLIFNALSKYELDLDDASSDAHSLSCSYANSVMSASRRSFTNSSVLSTAKASDIMTEVCERLDADPSLLEFSVDMVTDPLKSFEKKAAAPPSGIVSFLAKVLALCMKSATVSLLAIDDMHLCDEESWKVIQCLFEEGKKVLIVGTATTSNLPSFRISEDFARQLSEQYSETGRYLNLQVGSLTKEDVINMTMKSLGIRRQDVTARLANEVWVSNGLPDFAREIIQDIKLRSEGATSQVSEQVNEIVLHRVDSFEPELRNVLNIGAVIGSSFTLLDIIAVQQQSSDEDASSTRFSSVAAVKAALSKGILFIEGREATEAADTFDMSNDTVFRFQQEIWQSTLLGLLLDSRKRDIHRKIACAIQSYMKDDGTDTLEQKAKLFRHWKAAGDTTKATSIALFFGASFGGHAATLYEEALRMWHWDASMSLGIGGFSEQLLKVVSAKDLSNIISLLIAMGRAREMELLFTTSVTMYENALRVMQVARKSNDIQDRSILFPAFTGLAKAVKEGYISQNRALQYEQALTRRFLEETRSHGRLIHHIHALSLQMEVYERLGEFEKAIAVHSVIKSHYKPDRHSGLLIKVYGRDKGALSFSRASNWSLLVGETKTALKLCRHTLKDILPKIPENVDQRFDVLYPLLVVLKKTGYVKEADNFFQGVIVGKFPNSVGNELSRVFEPISTLHELVKGGDLSSLRLGYLKYWATEPENMCLGEELNKRLGKLGRCCDSICAEICLLLAKRLGKGDLRNDVLSHGRFLAEQAISFNRRHKLMAAQKLAVDLLEQLSKMPAR